MIYLLEDDDSIRELVCYTLTKTGMDAVGFGTPGDFWRALGEVTPELVLLDVMLPEQDGISVLKELRRMPEYQDVPVIMLTAKSDEYNKVIALDRGADDYITKPFGIMELVARVKAVLRRSNRTNLTTNIYKIGDLTIDTAKREVYVEDVLVSLTFKEFELLVLLAENGGAVLGRDRILREIWGYDFDGENRTVDVHVRTLRSKLGVCADLIETVRGVGYKMGVRK